MPFMSLELYLGSFELYTFEIVLEKLYYYDFIVVVLVHSSPTTLAWMCYFLIKYLRFKVEKISALWQNCILSICYFEGQAYMCTSFVIFILIATIMIPDNYLLTHVRNVSFKYSYSYFNLSTWTPLAYIFQVHK